MEENLGERINTNRTREAVGTGADQIAVGCPFCRVMLDDGLTAAQSRGEAREEVEVLDVAQMLLASVKGVSATRAAVVAGTAPGRAAPPAAGESEASPTGTTDTEEPPTVPDDAGSLFDTPVPPAPVEPVETKPAGGSLFDDASSLFDTPAPAQPPKAEPEATPEPEPEPEPAPTRQAEAAKPGLSGQLPDDVSLFDLGDPTPTTPPDPETILDADDESEAQRGQAAETKAEPSTKPVDGKIDEARSLFDL
jgi:hypothetical protein